MRKALFVLMLAGCTGGSVVAKDSAKPNDTDDASGGSGDPNGAGGGAHDCGTLVEEDVAVGQLPLSFDPAPFSAIAGGHHVAGSWWNGDSVGLTVSMAFTLDAVRHQGWSRPDPNDPSKCSEQWWVVARSEVVRDDGGGALTSETAVYLEAGVPSGLVPFHGGVSVPNAWWPQATRWPASVNSVVEASSSLGFTVEADGAVEGRGTIVPTGTAAPADTGLGESRYVEMLTFSAPANEL